MWWVILVIVTAGVLFWFFDTIDRRDNTTEYETSDDGIDMLDTFFSDIFFALLSFFSEEHGG